MSPSEPLGDTCQPDIHTLKASAIPAEAAIRRNPAWVTASDPKETFAIPLVRRASLSLCREFLACLSCAALPARDRIHLLHDSLQFFGAEFPGPELENLAIRSDEH
jgi:hypothetical protein